MPVWFLGLFHLKIWTYLSNLKNRITHTMLGSSRIRTWDFLHACASFSGIMHHWHCNDANLIAMELSVEVMAQWRKRWLDNMGIVGSTPDSGVDVPYTFEHKCCPVLDSSNTEYWAWLFHPALTTGLGLLPWPARKSVSESTKICKKCYNYGPAVMAQTCGETSKAPVYFRSHPEELLTCLLHIVIDHGMDS